VAGAEGLEPSARGFGGDAVQITACRKTTVFQQNRNAVLSFLFTLMLY